MSRPNDLVQGTLNLLILKNLALQLMHGWAIAQRIHLISGEVLQVGQSALYPALHKLEKWAISENGRRAKYYKPDQGRAKCLGTREGPMGASLRGDFAHRAIR